MLQNYMHTLTAFAIKTNFSIDLSLRRFIFHHLMRFITSIEKTIRYRKMENVSETQEN